MCDPDCLCVIFSFIRDEQPRVGWVVGGRGSGSVCVCVCVDSEGGQWAQEGVASLEMVNRIIKRTLMLPRRQKWLMISLIFVTQCNTGWTLWTFIASARHFQQAFHHTQLWPCEISCNFTNSQSVREVEKRERTCYRRLPDVPSIPWGIVLENSAWTFDT